jgi:hypothetical protein
MLYPLSYVRGAFALGIRRVLVRGFEFVTPLPTVCAASVPRAV